MKPDNSNISSGLAACSALAVAVLFICAAEVLHRFVAPIEAIPGWTYDEYVEHATKVKPDRDIVFLGDSRVGWGIAEKLITEALRKQGVRGRTAYNLGLPGASVEKEIDFLRHQWIGQSAHGGIIVINYSPAGWYCFENQITPPLRNDHTIQGATSTGFGTSIEALFKSVITTTPPQIIKDLHSLISRRTEQEDGRLFWEARTVFPEGFVNGTMARTDSRPIDKTQVQLDTYRAMYSSQKFKGVSTLQRKGGLIERIRQLQADGWRVVIIRLPIGSRMLSVEENAIRTDIQGSAVAAEIGLPFVDYMSDPRTTNIVTQDESHLTPDSARAIALILATDLVAN